MGKAFYDFDSRPFRDELLDAYVVPAARWFLGGSDGYLLPQLSGSNWECSLAIDFLLALCDECPALDPELVREISDKCLRTGRWLLSRIQIHEKSQSSWDGVSWDTAVCLRSLLTIREAFSADLSHSEKANIRRVVQTTTNWLVAQSLHWNAEVRYAAGPPDLAQVLHTLVLVAKVSPSVLQRSERLAGMPGNESVIDHIARFLLAMEETGTFAVADGTLVETSYWVDAFNSGEVLEGLTRYLEHAASAHRWGGQSEEGPCRAAVLRCLRFIELHQMDGTWGGVADTCGTLFAYLRVTADLPEVGHEDHVVFKGLRWMCDEKQSLSDGSFLHTSYVTVFYALALLQAYRSWSLGNRAASEVYDIALWSVPATATVERSLRLELQIALEDSDRLASFASDQFHRLRRTLIGVTAVLVLSVMLTGICLASGSIKLDGQIDGKIADQSLFWSIVAVGLPVITSITGSAVALLKRKDDKQIESKLRTIRRPRRRRNWRLRNSPGS